MAETIKKGVIKKKTDANNTVILYPKTTADQVEYESKTYTGLIGTANNFANSTFYFINVKPDSWTKEWTIKYKIEADLDNGLTPSNYQYMGSNHDCIISGTRGVMSAYSFFNSINHTSYRVQYYNALHETTEAGFNAGYPHKIGIELTDGYERTNTNYKRTYKITILEAINCTATLIDNPEIPSQSSRTDYTKVSATYYPNGVDSNTPGYCWRGNLYSQGLQESGDSNDVDRLYYHSQDLTISANLGLCGYSLLGFGTDGKVQALSKYNASYTYHTASISTNRVYNTGGFDYSRGLFRWVSSGYKDVNTESIISIDKLNYAVDFRYSDNVVNSANTTLTILGNKHVYLRGTIGTDGLFYLAPISVTYNGSTYKRVWTQDIPTTEDGYVYWLVGFPYNSTTYTYSVRLYAENPLYWFKNGQFREYLQNSNIENGTGTNAVRQKMADATVDFTGRNPNAEAIDSTISTTINTGASGSQSVAFGKNTMALSTATLTQGNKTLAKGEESHAEGYQSVTLGDGSHAEGARTTAVGLQSHSEGADTVAKGEASHSEGHSTTADNYYAHAEGEDTIASGHASHAEGEASKATALSSHAEGSNNYIGVKPQDGPGGGGEVTPSQPSGYDFAAGESSHAEGFDNFVYGAGSHAEGAQNVITGTMSHAEGVKNTIGDTDGAHAEGYQTTVTGTYAHAEGQLTQAEGYASHAEGTSTRAHGTCSHAEGSTTTAYANFSHTMGTGTYAGNESMLAIGKYNSNISNTLFVVGNGRADNNRSNAFEVYQDGHAEVALMGSTASSVTTKQYVDNNYLGKTAKAADSDLLDGHDSSYFATASSVPTTYLRSAQAASDTLTITPSSGNAVTFNNYYPNRSYTSGLQISTANHQNYTNGALYVPNATSSQAGVVTTGSQTFAGDKTFNGAVTINNSFVSTAGSTSISNYLYTSGGVWLSGGSVYSAADFRPSGSVSLGTKNEKWTNLFLSGTIRDGKNNNYGLALPDTTNYSANKTIATTDDIPDDSNLVHKDGDTMTGGLMLNIGSGYSSSPNLTFVTSNGAGSFYKSDETLYFAHTGVHSYTLTFPMQSGTVALTSNIPPRIQILDYRS